MLFRSVRLNHVDQSTMTDVKALPVDDGGLRTLNDSHDVGAELVDVDVPADHFRPGRQIGSERGAGRSEHEPEESGAHHDRSNRADHSFATDAYLSAVLVVKPAKGFCEGCSSLHVGVRERN